MTGGVGEGVELDVAAFQFGIEAGDLVVAVEQEGFGDNGADAKSEAAVLLGPGLRAASHGLLPGFEGAARADALAGFGDFDGLFGVAGPLDGPDNLGAEPEQEVGSGRDNADGGQAGRGYGEVLGEPVGEEELILLVGREPLDEGENLGERRGRADESALAVDVEGGAFGAHRLDQQGGVGAEYGSGIGLIAEGLVEGIQHLGVAGDMAAVAALLGDGDLHGEEAGEDIADYARPVRDIFRRGVMAGDQSPEAPVSDQRDRHGGADTHVAQVLDMDGRHGPQDGVGHVEGPAGDRIGFGDQGNARGRDVRLQAEGAEEIEATGLGRDIGGRVAETEEGVEVRAADFGDNFAAVVREEAVDHDAAEAGEGADEAGHAGAEFGCGGGAGERGEGIGQVRMKIGAAVIGRRDRGFDFENQKALVAVDDGLKALRAAGNAQAAQVVRDAVEVPGEDFGTEIVDVLRFENVGEGGAAQEDLGRGPEAVAGIAAHLDEVEPRFEHDQQGAMRFDRTRNFDGFAFAGAQVYMIR